MEPISSPRLPRLRTLFERYGPIAADPADDAVTRAIPAVSAEFLRTFAACVEELVGPGVLERCSGEFAIIPSSQAAAGCVVSERVIWLTSGFVRMVDFLSSWVAVLPLHQAYLEAAAREGLIENASDYAREASATFYETLCAQLVLGQIGEKEFPDLRTRLPPHRVKLVERLGTGILLFAVLHEQAHLALDGGSDASSTRMAEELAADAWAIDQIPAPFIPFLLNAAGYYFLEQWLHTYSSYVAGGSHPTVYTRIKALADRHAGCEHDETGSIVEVAAMGARLMSSADDALGSQDRKARFAQVLSRCRERPHTDLEVFVDRLTRLADLESRVRAEREA
jgi:hypothetical protein